MFRLDSLRQNSGSDLSNDDMMSSSSSSGSLQGNSFLQRIASSEALTRPAQRRGPSGPPPLHKSASSSTVGSASSSSTFSIPIPGRSWGMKMLSQLHMDTYGHYDDIIQLLLQRDKAVLLLPVARPSHPSATIDLDFVKNHTLVYTSSKDRHRCVTLSGIRGIFQSDQFIALDALSTEYDARSFLVQDDRAMVDNFDLDMSSITPDQPHCNILASHVPVKLKGDQTIHAMLIQKPISKTEVLEWTKKQSASHSTSPEAVSPVTILDDPLADRVIKFIKTFRHRPPKTMDMASTQWADFLDELHALMNTDQPSQERLDAIECYLCSELYEILFAPSVDKAQDEILQSRVAALNLLDLDMGHLGVTVQTEDQQAVDDMIQSAGKQLQQLNSLFTAKGKLESLVKTHQGIVDAIEALAVKEKGESSGSDVDVVQEIHMAMTSAQEEETSKHHEIKVNASPADAPDTSNSTNESDSGQGDKDTTRLGTASADVLLPLLIYTIVKTNPTNFISNLKFTQRFRRPSQLTGMASYCVTNITAAVTFLETTNLVGLGLSADKVHSNVTDLNALPQSSGAKQPSAPSPSATTSGGLRLVSEVMDSSYKMFDGIGRFWQRSGDAVALNAKLGDMGTTSQGGASSSVSGSHARSPPRLFSTSELKEMTASALTSFTKKEAPAPANADTSTSNTSSQWDSAVPGFMEHRKTAPKPPSTKSDPLQALLQAPSQLMHSIQSRPASNAQPAHDQPIQKFLDIKSVNDLTIGDITELLADYKRLAAILKQSNAIP